MIHRRIESLPLALRTGVGLSLLAIGASGIGAAVVAVVLLLLTPVGSQVVGHDRVVLLATAISYVVVAVIVGVAVGVTMQRRTVLWLVLGRQPTTEEATRALRLPSQLALLVAALWTVAALVVGVVTLALTGWELAGRVVSAVAIGGLATVGLTYQLAVSATKPLVAEVLRLTPADRVLATGLLPRLVLTWSLTVGVQLLGALELLIDRPSPTQRLGVGVLVSIALVTGALSTVLIARTLGAPLRQLRGVVRRVGEGDLGVDVVVDDPGEIGLLQAGVRDMVAGLRERDRITDLFGRHVGAAVAREALRTGVQLGGERREAVALFVDVIGSTGLAESASPEEVVAKLNRLFTVVVDAVEDAGGLVNKFEGDAALCIFGAPVQIDGAETAALRAGRAIRDTVRSHGELDVGIGIASGEVVAGQVGARSRLEYTVIGDAVNEAARITELAKSVQGRLLASGSVVGRASEDERSNWREYDDVVLRGRSTATHLWAAN